MFLRWIRNVLAVAAFVILLAITFEPHGVTAQKFHYLVDYQLITALAARAFAIVAIILVVTLLFGRIYCSILCPLGILQDILSKLGRMTLRRGNHYHKGRPVLRLTLFLVLGAAAFYAVYHDQERWLNWLNPFEIFENISVHCFAPIWNYVRRVFSFSPIPESQMNILEIMGGAMVAGLSLAVIGGLAFRFGRVFCNVVCPVGTALSFFSRFSLFRVWIDRSECVSCGRCSALCKAHCIDLRHKKVEVDRCVGCMDCLANCPKDSIHYRPFFLHHETSRVLEINKSDTPSKSKSASASAAVSQDSSASSENSSSRRSHHSEADSAARGQHHHHSHHHSHRHSPSQGDSASHRRGNDILAGLSPQERQRVMLRQQARHRQKKIEALLPPEEQENLRRKREERRKRRREYELLREQLRIRLAEEESKEIHSDDSASDSTDVPKAEQQPPKDDRSEQQ